ncbi:hypothetical protein NSPZN2_110064 [Nitrospira defluvii]|uniref:Uncharacterized protein n=1 Tax=Nitrospira defluvii TaxID=330214 RepID=A0ABN7LCF9_9BACT|nr:hypothetical protein NSPZN2_110064 [Nitrospira defluvii]
MKPSACFASMKPCREPSGTDRHFWNLPSFPASSRLPSAYGVELHGKLDMGGPPEVYQAVKTRGWRTVVLW